MEVDAVDCGGGLRGIPTPIYLTTISIYQRPDRGCGSSGRCSLSILAFLAAAGARPG